MKSFDEFNEEDSSKDDKSRAKGTKKSKVSKMKHPEEHYKKITHNGFKWWGFVDGLHNFSKKEGKGFINMKVREEQLTNGDFEFMADKGLTL